MPKIAAASRIMVSRISCWMWNPTPALAAAEAQLRYAPTAHWHIGLLQRRLSLSTAGLRACTGACCHWKCSHWNYPSTVSSPPAVTGTGSSAGPTARQWTLAAPSRNAGWGRRRRRRRRRRQCAGCRPSTPCSACTGCGRTVCEHGQMSNCQQLAKPCECRVLGRRVGSSAMRITRPLLAGTSVCAFVTTSRSMVSTTIEGFHVLDVRRERSANSATTTAASATATTTSAKAQAGTCAGTYNCMNTLGHGRHGTPAIGLL